jgi:hypothetical protein
LTEDNIRVSSAIEKTQCVIKKGFQDSRETASSRSEFSSAADCTAAAAATSLLVLEPGFHQRVIRDSSTCTWRLNLAVEF